MNYTLAQLQERVTELIKEQGAGAHCAAWIYTAEDCKLEEDNGTTSYPCEDYPELAELIFDDLGQIDYIYTTIQDCVDECTEERFMQVQQELN